MFGRRRFLKGLGLATLGAAGRSVIGVIPVAAASKAVSSGGRLYLADGAQVYVSANAGATWQLHTDFTSVYSVKGLAVDRTGALRATIGFQGRGFGLLLAANQQAWLTA